MHEPRPGVGAYPAIGEDLVVHLAVLISGRPFEQGCYAFVLHGRFAVPADGERNAGIGNQVMVFPRCVYRIEDDLQFRSHGNADDSVAGPALV